MQGKVVSPQKNGVFTQMVTSTVNVVFSVVVTMETSKLLKKFN